MIEATGKKLWAEPSPNYFKAKYNNFKKFDGANIGESGIAIDTVNNLFHTSDLNLQLLYDVFEITKTLKKFFN